MPYFALLDNAIDHRARLYQRHHHSDFLPASELDKIDSLLQHGWAQGWHVVFCADYEAGLPLLNLPERHPQGHFALHWFEQCQVLDNAETWLAQHSHTTPSGISTPESNTSKNDYLHAISQIHEAIKRGETYQINYTTRLHLQAYGDPIQLYHRLRQPVPYAALCHLPNTQGEPHWQLCFSPELFLNIHSDGLITTEPMKGTAPILNDGQDQARAEALRSDPKNRAENIMIADLLRNDLGKIALTGQVRAPEPLKVQAFGSVWQMTTAVHAQAKPQTCFAQILRATFPCGSITGAPKRMSMQLISQLEKSPRQGYTGSIGFLEPCTTGLGFHGVLNVVIRTLALTPISDGLYRGEYGVGSGVVIDSEAEAEYTECQWKAHFLSQLAPEYGLFETMKAEQQHIALLPLHLRRLAQSAHALNIPFQAHQAEQHIQEYLTTLPTSTQRVKANLTPNGALTLSHTDCAPLPAMQRAIIAAEPLPRHNYLRRFKTTHRALYNQHITHASEQGAFDSLFFNSDGLLLEGARSNIFVQLNQEWYTPSLDLDILNGVMRQHILAHPQLLHTSHIHESHIHIDMLRHATTIYLSNALRGLIAVQL